eukprot:gnl/MRDRNA2_/MRDRNA2_125079_c0_seq1.p1 gnl/MRDRNA2_/MRDRNA2_125079_c0~~gnl/MRDRNA2_/MRDRNA2_125079_c0_seq1.p1  ORF type:complete len:288 (-),score=33.60 gnl/MRDRNA2_/MRDRNA2_125079_c0_seq1:781-1644(-)
MFLPNGMRWYVQLEDSSIDQKPCWHPGRISGRPLCCSVVSSGVVVVFVMCEMMLRQGAWSLLAVSYEPLLEVAQRPGKDPSGVTNLANIMQRPVFLPKQRLGFLSGFPYPALRPEFHLSSQNGMQGGRRSPQQVIAHASSYEPSMHIEERWMIIQVWQDIMRSITNTETKKAQLDEGQVGVVHSEEDFDNCLKRSSELVVLEFVERGCRPCKFFEPKYKRMAMDYNGKATFFKVAAKENESTYQLAKRFRAEKTPSFYVLRNGDVVAKEQGVKAEVNLRNTLNQLAR